MVVKILKSIFDGIIEHAETGYPEEVCGVLIGKEETINEFRKCRNLNRERAKDRYELDPISFQESDNWARVNNLEILGIYHSHPDHPSLPSEFDRSHAWSVWIYIIFSISNGRFNDARAWLLDDSKHTFKENLIDLL